MRKQVYTIQEVASLLRFSDQTIREWARSGRIKAVQPGLRAWRVPRAEVERLLAQFQIDESVLDTVTGEITDTSDEGKIPHDIRTPMSTLVLNPRG